ncbi:uncharacterized protein EV422DRAFT_509586 [Fimicolochytrium jonesii]|uniref:uncharacterized protein n=1 Tax=Fimicolochytrium jonesii TaxID=1396493 RepID=UPI0022FE6500|nr:uncharacterized protein EV422DRAFT_509586 [Fimicolochytrium jonesii]KAI8816750.1 hypothetical protein EV422DRAFT_509586 [Fimicolochytrium jonesii]
MGANGSWMWIGGWLEIPEFSAHWGKRLEMNHPLRCKNNSIPPGSSAKAGENVHVMRVMSVYHCFEAYERLQATGLTLGNPSIVNWLKGHARSNQSHGQSQLAKSDKIVSGSDKEIPRSEFEEDSGTISLRHSWILLEWDQTPYGLRPIAQSAAHGTRLSAAAALSFHVVVVVVCTVCARGLKSRPDDDIGVCERGLRGGVAGFEMGGSKSSETALRAEAKTSRCDVKIKDCERLGRLSPLEHELTTTDARHPGTESGSMERPETTRECPSGTLLCRSGNGAQGGFSSGRAGSPAYMMGQTEIAYGWLTLKAPQDTPAILRDGGTTFSRCMHCSASGLRGKRVKSSQNNPAGAGTGVAGHEKR